MDARQSKFAVRLLPSLTDFAFLMPLVFLFGRMEGAKTLLADGDTGWHIRTGEWILAHHAVPRTDIFSFSKPGEAWYAWEWLADVIWAWLHSHGGLALLALACAMLLSATFTIVFRVARRRSNPIIAIAVTMAAAADSSLHWLARPHLFTLLFLALFCLVLEQVRSGRERFGRVPYLVLLPGAMLLWTNLHGGFFVGIVVIAAYGIGELLKVALSPDQGERRPAWRRARNYLLAAAGCMAASLVNPYSYHLHQHVLRYLRDPYQSRYIMEFLSLNFHHPMGMFFEITLLAGAVAAYWHASRGRFIEPVVILVWGHGALLASRNLPIFAIASAPFVASAIAEGLARLPASNVAAWLKSAALKFNGVASELADTDSIRRWHVASAAGAAVVAALLLAPNPPRPFQAVFDPRTFPARAVEMLSGDPQARIFSLDQWGDYLIYKRYPQGKVFIDGRSDFYGAEFGRKAMDAQTVKYDWERTLNRFGVDTVLLPPTVPLAGALKESRRWRLAYDDGVALVFRSLANRGGGAMNPVSATAESGQAPSPAARGGDGTSRDREITKTKTQASDPVIAQIPTT